MGGMGSGRPGWKQKAEAYRSIDVDRLRRAGFLRLGYFGGWEWTREGERVGNIGMKMQAGRLVLNYRVRIWDDDWQETEQPVPIEWSACRYGGARPYFRCSGVVNGRHCGRRVAKLFAGGRYFLCRHCYRLAYSCQSEPRQDRLSRGANKRRMAIGGEPGTCSLPPAKPKGMHWRTYDANIDEINRLEAQADIAFLGWVTRRFPGIRVDDLFD